jgi:ribosomal protein L37AE/L43A
MKNVVIKSVLFAFIAILGSSVFFSATAQSKTATPKVYAVINKAEWCPVCQANGAKVMNEVIPACKNLNVKFVANNLTNEQTIAKSTLELKKNKVFNAVKETKSTGLILLVDAKTKKVIKQISVTAPAEEIIKEITAAQG